jgi:hypothetical protein
MSNTFGTSQFILGIDKRRTLDVVALLTLLLIILFGFNSSYFQYPSQILVLFALVNKKALRNSYYWFTLACLGSSAIIWEWHPVDNHKFILVYWLWSLFLASSLEDEKSQEKALHRNAAFLIALVMLGSIFQKIYSGTYLDGTFFEITLLTDDRFEALLVLLGVNSAITTHAQESLSAIQSAHILVDGDRIFLKITPYFHIIALTVTWWNIGIQIIIEGSLLIGRRIFDLIAHAALLTYILTTYLVAPIFGFGWVLSMLGFTLTHKSYPRIAVAYLASFPILLIYQFDLLSAFLKLITVR